MDNRIIDFKGQTVENADFSGQTLDGYDFTGAELLSCNFDNAHLSRVSFKKATLSGCRFRSATIERSDCRYAKFDGGTFEDAVIDWCDFYRAMFDGIILFNGARVSNSSLNKTYFGDSAFLKKDNLVNGRIIQQDRKAWTKFLVDWHTFSIGGRTNDTGAASAWDPTQSVKHRWAEAEEIYKNFNALWTGRGFIADGNWAYIQGRRMERRRMIRELAEKKVSIGRKAGNVWKILTNALSDLFFGYGESLTRMIVTYVLTVFLFAWLFCSEVSLLEYGQALAISLKNMAGMDSDILKEVSPLVDMLNVLQTTIGIILTGIFGFILGNKIRNQ